jgi:hypothetical protein
MGIEVAGSPSVAPSSQRWAEGWNPVGIQVAFARQRLVGMVISITFRIAQYIRRSNQTLAAISSPVRGAIVVETARQ